MPAAQFTMDNNRPLIDSNIPELELLHRGKVRDVYAVDEDRLLLVATDGAEAHALLNQAGSLSGEVMLQEPHECADFLCRTVPIFL